MTTSGPVALAVSTASRSARRAAGPTAWAVFEELAFEAKRENSELVVTTSVRRLAAELGLAKDTVARALSRLRELGHVEAQGQRQPGGRFGGSVYRLRLPEGMDVSEEATESVPTAASAVSDEEGRGRRRSRRRVSRSRAIQEPTLFDQSSDDATTDSNASHSDDPTAAQIPTANAPSEPDALAPEVREAAGVIEGDEYLQC